MKERKAAQNYYINEKNDYYSIMRYIITYPLGYEVIKDYCKGRFDSIDEEMDSFLVQPIRDYMQDMKSDLEDGKLSLNMNDMMINSINYNYNELKKLVCYSNCKTNMVLLQKYLVKLFSSMQHKVSKLIDGYIVDSQNVKEKDIIQKYRCELGEHGVVNIIKYEKNNKLVTACKLFFDVEMCISNCEILQALVSVILQLDLQHYSNLEILILNLPDKLVSIELRDLISDIFPQVSCQLILTVKQSEKNAFWGNNIGLQVGQDSIEKVSTILKKLGEHDEKVFLMLNDCILLKCEEICRVIKKYINNYELYFIKTEDKELAKNMLLSFDGKVIFPYSNEKEKTVRKHPKSNLTFQSLGIPVGSKLVFTGDESLIVTTIDDNNKVEYYGVIKSLSSMAKYLFEQLGKANNSGAYQGGMYFKYKNQKLIDIRKERERTEK